MEKLEEYSVSFLESCSYRTLQHFAKSLHLPSNVKKIYLIQLIYAKKNCTQNEVDSIVARVRAERQRLAQINNRKKNAKKLRLQAAEISSTNTFSPPIDLTPKRAGFVKSPVNRYRQNIVNSIQTFTSQSDRVLRSFNMRTYKKTNYNIMNSSLVDLLEYPRRPEAHINIIRRERNPQVNMAHCVLRKYKPSHVNECQAMVPVNRNMMTVPVRRQQRALSGIYPLPPPETSRPNTYDFIQSIGYRRNNGKISQINALVHKNGLTTTNNYANNSSYKSIDYNLSESASKAISTLTERLLKNYPNMSVTKESSIDLTESEDEALNLVQLKNKYTNTEYLKRNSTEQVHTSTITSQIDTKQETVTNVDVTKEIVKRNQEFETEENVIENANSDFNETESTLSRVTTLSDTNQYNSLDDNHVNKSSESSVTESTVSSSTNLTTTFTDSTFCDDVPLRSENVPPLTDITKSNDNTTNTSTFSECIIVTNKEAYIHKKIRAERVRNQRLSYSVPDAGLPKINYVFSKFNDFSKNISQPLYVQVDDDARQISVQPIYTTTQKPVLEILYNLSQCLPPALTLAPHINVASTTSVYTTPCIATAILQPTTFAVEQTSYPAERETYQVAVNEQLSRKCDLSMPEQEITLRNYQEVAQSEPSSPEQQDLNATIPEMIEDALEIMSQDGDYMERIGMDVRMQCILCSWAGPKIILEYHIRKEHQSQILCQERSEWCISVPLSLVRPQQVWVSHVAEYNHQLYATSVRVQSFYVLVTLQSISSEYEQKRGSLTIFNRATGEPYIWNGTIQDISSNMPFESECEQLVVPQNQINDTHITILVNVL